MAKIKYSGLIDAMSGKLGGSIISQGANGAYIKQNAYSQQHASSKQLTQRYKIGVVTQIWRSLTAAERLEWQNAVIDYPYIDKFGNTAYYTAYQLFTYMNLNRQVLVLGVITSPPIYNPIVSPTGLSFANTTPYCALLTNNGTIGNSVAVFITDYTLTATPPVESSFIFAKSFVLTAAGENLVVTNEVIENFGLPIAGRYNHFGFKCYDTASGANNGFEYAQPWLIT